MSMSIISRMYARARSQLITPSERQVLLGALLELQADKKILRHKNPPRKVVRAPKIAHPKPRKTICSLCKMPLPHQKGESGRAHMARVRQARSHQLLARYWRRVGYDILWKRSVAARHQRALNKRALIFQEIAPHAYAILGHDAVKNLADSRRDGTKRWLGPLKRWRSWVKAHYAG